MLERRVVLSEHEVSEKVSLFSTCSSVLVGRTTRVIINISSKHLRGCHSLYSVLLCYLHFEITGGPCNLISSHRCDLFMNRTILCALNHNPSQWNSSAKHNHQSHFKSCLKKPIKLQENERQILHLFKNQLKTGQF